jgi:hypothetical protein
MRIGLLFLPAGKFGGNSPHIHKEHPRGKTGENIFGKIEPDVENKPSAHGSDWCPRFLIGALDSLIDT